jgi:hypothetical protein
MKIPSAAHYAIGICGAVITLAGCGESQPIDAPATIPQLPATATHAEHNRSWMLPVATSNNLLYVVDQQHVLVYTYPRGKLVGTLTGFNYPEGDCVDKAGDIFIASYGAGKVREYAHGGTKPIATLTDPGYYPENCSIDPTTGNLAVTEFVNPGPGHVAIYANAQGTPTRYTDPAMYEYSFCSYDNAGNLFVDGQKTDFRRKPFAFAKLPKGSSTFTNIALSQKPIYATGLRWDGRYVAVAGWEDKVIYQFAITGQHGKEVSSTSLDGANFGAYPFWIQGSTLILPNVSKFSLKGNVQFYHYPTGGRAIKTITGLKAPSGATVSLAR